MSKRCLRWSTSGSIDVTSRPVLRQHGLLARSVLWCGPLHSSTGSVRALASPEIRGTDRTTLPGIRYNLLHATFEVTAREVQRMRAR